MKRRASQSVALLLTAEGTHFCTGTLLNNGRQDGRLLLLTAGHCVPARPDLMLFGFGYEHGACEEELAGMEPGMRTLQGGRVLATGKATDFALLELREQPDPAWGLHLSGWDRRPHAPVNVVCLHHPRGDVKKVSYLEGACRPAQWSEPPAHRWHWEVPSWTAGITEMGSSGAGLFNAAGLLVGQLHGGQSSCANPGGWDRFGALAYSWDRGQQHLAPFLDPDNLNLETLNGMTLDGIARTGMPLGRKA